MATEHEIAQLRAEAAAAAAEAAELKAAAAAARLEAAEAALRAAAAGEGAPEVAAAEVPTEETASDSDLTELETEIRAAYDVEGAALQLGALLVDEAPEPRVQVRMPLRTLNRHGLVAGATGTGKTRTLQLLAEQLSDQGVPVFITDIKGDLTGLAQAGEGGEKLLARTAALGQAWAPKTFPLELFALGGRGEGVPLRTTITDFGPLLLAKVLDLNATQESSLALIFHWADQQGLAIMDMKDLRAVITYLTSDEGKAELKGIGGISTATAGVILRELAALEAQGGDIFFGEPAFDTQELLRVDADGRGVISALEVSELSQQPQLFSTFIMWLLADLFTSLPEVGDPDKPKLVFFFDEAHFLFSGASKEFLRQVVQTVRLIRSKGVGVFFVTQNPKDIPDDVLAQLGNKVQHALRAHTPADAERLAQAVKTYPSTTYDLRELLTSLGTGEAVVTVLDPKGVPTPVAPTRLVAPQSVMGAASDDVLAALRASSPLRERYAERVDDPNTAYELLTVRIERERAEAAEAEIQAVKAAELEKILAAEEKERAKEEARILKDAEARAARAEREREREAERARVRRERQIDSVIKDLGREITRSIFGTRKR